MTRCLCSWRGLHVLRLSTHTELAKLRGQCAVHILLDSRRQPTQIRTHRHCLTARLHSPELCTVGEIWICIRFMGAIADMRVGIHAAVRKAPRAKVAAAAR